MCRFDVGVPLQPPPPPTARSPGLQLATSSASGLGPPPGLTCPGPLRTLTFVAPAVPRRPLSPLSPLSPLRPFLAPAARSVSLSVLFFTFEDVTAFFFSCLLPTLFFGSFNAA